MEEHATHNGLVVGSIPTSPTIIAERIKQVGDQLIRMASQLQAHHWVLVRLERVRTRIKPWEFKAALEKVLPYVHESYADEKLQEFKNDALKFVVNFTDGGNLLAALLDTTEWGAEPNAILLDAKQELDNIAKELESCAP